MKSNDLSNQISMNEIYGLGLHPEDRLILINDILLDTFFGNNSKLSAKALRILSFYFSRIFKDDPEKYYVVLTREELVEICQDQELKDLNKIIDEFKSCYIKIKAVSGSDELSREVAAFEFGYRKNKDNRRIKEFILSCNSLPEVKDLFFNLVKGHYFTGVYKLVSELEGNDKNVKRTIRFYWYLKKNTIRNEWYISENDLKSELGCEKLASDINTFKKYVLKPIISAINEHSDLSVDIDTVKSGSEHKTIGYNITCSEKVLLPKKSISSSDYNLDLDKIRSSIKCPALSKMSDTVICQCYKALEEKLNTDYEGDNLHQEICKTLNRLLERIVSEDEKKRKAGMKPIISYDKYVKGAVDKFVDGKHGIRTNPRKTGKEAGITLDPKPEPESNNTNPTEKFHDEILDMFHSDDNIK